MEIGDRAMFFDYAAWRQAGGDVGDNAIFLKPATVCNRYVRDDNLEIVDIVWDHLPATVSKGHFTTHLKHIPEGDYTSWSAGYDEGIQGHFHDRHLRPVSPSWSHGYSRGLQDRLTLQTGRIIGRTASKPTLREKISSLLERLLGWKT